jgi:hypothetical protein
MRWLSAQRAYLRSESICAVIPAARRGCPTGLDVPKIPAPIGADCNVRTLTREGSMVFQKRWERRIGLFCRIQE